MVGGFTIVGGTGLPVKAGAVCSVTALTDEVQVRVEIGADDAVIPMPYRTMTAAELAGGAQTSGGGFVGGGFGFSGAVEGMAVASVLNSLTRKTTVNTGFHLATTEHEMLLHHGELGPKAIRNGSHPCLPGMRPPSSPPPLHRRLRPRATILSPSSNDSPACTSPACSATRSSRRRASRSSRSSANPDPGRRVSRCPSLNEPGDSPCRSFYPYALAPTGRGRRPDVLERSPARISRYLQSACTHVGASANSEHLGF